MRTLLASLALSLLPVPALAAEAAAGALTLDDALALAARQNGDLEIARAGRDDAAAGLTQSWSGILPRLDLTGAFGRQHYAPQKSVQFAPSASGGFDLVVSPVPSPAFGVGSHQVGISLKWNFFDGMGTWNRIGAARSALRGAERQLDESGLQVAFEVTRRFYEVVKQERTLVVRDEAVARSEELVARADALYAAGRGTKADTFAARVNLGNDRVAVQAQRAALARARADLAVVLGLMSEGELRVEAPATLASVPPARAAEELAPLPELVARARRSRALLAARQAALQAAEAQAAQARAAYWPTLGLQGSYLRSSPTAVGSYGAIGDPSVQYTATGQVTLTWNLFQGRETQAAVDKAEAQVRRARAEAAQAEQAVAAELARAREGVVTLSRSAALSQENLSAAEQGLQLARERLEAGAASQLEVRDATQKLAEAKLSFVSALVDHAVARADLNRALGGTL
jgi:outer membrane protein TolC